MDTPRTCYQERGRQGYPWPHTKPRSSEQFGRGSCSTGPGLKGTGMGSTRRARALLRRRARALLLRGLGRFLGLWRPGSRRRRPAGDPPRCLQRPRLRAAARPMPARLYVPSTARGQRAGSQGAADCDAPGQAGRVTRSGPAMGTLTPVPTPQGPRPPRPGLVQPRGCLSDSALPPGCPLLELTDLTTPDLHPGYGDPTPTPSPAPTRDPSGPPQPTMVPARPGADRAPHSSTGFSKRLRRPQLISAAGASGSSPHAADQWTREAESGLPAFGHAH